MKLKVTKLICLCYQVLCRTGEIIIWDMMLDPRQQMLLLLLRCCCSTSIWNNNSSAMCDKCYTPGSVQRWCPVACDSDCDFCDSDCDILILKSWLISIYNVQYLYTFIAVLTLKSVFTRTIRVKYEICSKHQIILGIMKVIYVIQRLCLK